MPISSHNTNLLPSANAFVEASVKSVANYDMDVERYLATTEGPPKRPPSPKGIEAAGYLRWIKVRT